MICFETGPRTMKRVGHFPMVKESERNRAPAVTIRASAGGRNEMPEGEGDRDRERAKSRWVWLTPLALVAVLVLLYFVWPSFRTFFTEAYQVLSSGSRERIQTWVSGFGVWSYVVVIALMLLQTLLAFLPSVVLMVVAVVSFGSIVGGLLAWGGLLLAASLGYVIGRMFGVVTVDRLLGTRTERKMEHFIERYGLWAVVAARISPVLSTDAVSIAAGLGRMRFPHFVAATAFGTLPLTVLIAWLGADIDRLKTGLVWVSIVSVATFLTFVVYDHRRRRDADDQ